jgi:hypothetical protein
MTNSRPSLSQALGETATRTRRKRLSVKILQVTDLRTRKSYDLFTAAPALLSIFKAPYSEDTHNSFVGVTSDAMHVAL